MITTDQNSMQRLPSRQDGSAGPRRSLPVEQDEQDPADQADDQGDRLHLFEDAFLHGRLRSAHCGLSGENTTARVRTLPITRMSAESARSSRLVMECWYRPIMISRRTNTT